MSGHKSKVLRMTTSYGLFQRLINVQKRKTESTNNDHEAAPDTTKPSAVFKPTGGRDFTLSIALPGSIIAKYDSINVLTYVVKDNGANHFQCAYA